jgi:hypothetical protein
VSRKVDFVVVYSKPGYQDKQIEVKSGVSGGGAAGLAGNIVAGGIIGVVVDASTGAGLTHEPNPVMAVLEPIKDSPVIAIDRKRRRSVPQS